MDINEIKSFLRKYNLIEVLFVIINIENIFTCIEREIAFYISSFSDITIAEAAVATAEAALTKARAEYEAQIKAKEEAVEKANRDYSHIDTFYWNHFYQNKEYRTLEKSLQGSKYYLKCQRDYISAAEIAKAERVIERKQKALDEYVYSILNANNESMTLEQAKAAKDVANAIEVENFYELMHPLQTKFREAKEALELNQNRAKAHYDLIFKYTEDLEKAYKFNSLVALRNEVAAIFVSRYNNSYNKLATMVARYEYLSDNASTDDEIDEYCNLEESIERQYEKVSKQQEAINSIYRKIKDAKVEELQSNKNNPGYWMVNRW